MAGSFNPETNGLDMNNLIEALQTIMDAAQGLRNFNNEVSDSTRQVTSNKKAAQDMFRGLAKNATDAGRELDRTAKELKRINDALPYIVKNTMSTIEKNFAFTSQELNRNFKLDKWMNPVFNEYRILQKKSVKEFEDQLEDIETALASVTDEVERASLKYQKDLIEERKEHVKNKNEWQLMASDNAEYWKTQVVKAGKKVLGDLYNFAKSKINSAVSSYASTMQSTYTTIQSYNNYTEKQYNQMFKRLQKSIDDAGLNNIININELQQQYTGAIQGGLTGKNAETNAYYAQIAKQAGVTFDWNDSNWLKTYSRMSKQGNDMEKLSQDIIVATENMMEAAGNGFAFTNGQINAMVDNLNQLQGSLNLTDEAYIAAYKSFGTAGSMLNEWGIDATKIYADITKYATSDSIVSGSVASILNMGGLDQAEAERLIESGQTDDIVIKYLTELQNRYDKTTGEFVKVASDKLGESLSPEEIQAYQEYVKYLSDNNLTVEEEFKRIYDYDKWAYDKMIESLENSETGQDKMQNTLDNILDEIGKFTTDHPILAQIGQSLMTVAEAATFGYFAGGTDSVGGRTIQTLLNKLGGKGGSSASGSSSGSFFKNIFKSKSGGVKATGFEDDVAQQMAMNFGDDALGAVDDVAAGVGKVAGKGGKALSALGKVGKVAGKVAPWLTVASVGIDAVKGYKDDGLAGAVRSAITGSSKKANSAGDILKGTGSAALAGAGIGAFFGPLGAGIGAAVGAIAGLTTTLIDYNSEEQKRARRFAELDKYVSSSTDAAKEYSKTVKELTDLENLAKKSTEGETASTQELIKKYPILAKYVGKNGEVTAEYTDVLEQLMEVESKKLNAQVINKYGSSAGVKGTDTSNSVKKSSDSIKAQQYQLEIAKAAKTEYNGEAYGANYSNTGDFTSMVDGVSSDELLEMGRKQFNISEDAWNAMTVREKVGFLTDRGFLKTEHKYIKRQGKEYASTSALGTSDFSKYLQKNYEPDYSDLEKYYTAAVNAAGLFSSIYSYDSLAEAATWSDLSEKEVINKLNAAIVNYNAVMKYARNEDESIRQLMTFVADGYDIYDPAAWVKSIYGEATPGAVYSKFSKTSEGLYEPFYAKNVFDVKPDGSHAVGTIGDSTIPYDNYLAYLHKGEQVRTAAEVAVERAEQHVASSNAIGQLNSAVMQQTNTIISLLTQILSVTTSLAGRVGSKPAQSYDYCPVSI